MEERGGAAEEASSKVVNAIWLLVFERPQSPPTRTWFPMPPKKNEGAEVGKG